MGSVALVVVLAGVSGCRTNPQIALLEMENRLLEDRIYELEAQLAKQGRQLASGQQQIGGVQNVPAKTVAPAPSSGAKIPSGVSTPVPGPGAYTPPQGGNSTPIHSGSGLPSVNVQMPGEALPPGDIPKTLRTSPGEPLRSPPGSSGPELNTPESLKGPIPNESSSAFERNSTVSPILGGLSSGAPGRQTGLVLGQGWVVGFLSSRVQSLRLVPELTGPYNPDGQPGDEGITVGLAPLDARGQLVPAAAPISIVLIDPAISDASGRVARWDLTAEQIAALSQTLSEGESLRLAFVWPKQTPQHKRLHLFVRYVTADGRKLQADMPLEVDIQAQQMHLLTGPREADNSRRPNCPGPEWAGSPGISLLGSLPPGRSPLVSENSPSGPESEASMKMASRPEAAGSETHLSLPGRQPRIPWKPTR